MPRTTLFRLCLVIAAGCIATPARALDLTTLIGRADTASTATVFLVPPMALFRASLDEARMQASACRFTTSDPGAIRALVALLRSGGVAASAVYQRPDMREGIYLTLDDGTLLKFLLQDNLGGKLPVTGVAETATGGNLQTIGMTARETVAGDVRTWAAQRGGAGTGSACDRLVPQSIAP